MLLTDKLDSTGLNFSIPALLRTGDYLSDETYPYSAPDAANVVDAPTAPVLLHSVWSLMNDFSFTTE